jgi:hypothetical protein
VTHPAGPCSQWNPADEGPLDNIVAFDDSFLTVLLRNPTRK